MTAPEHEGKPPRLACPYDHCGLIEISNQHTGNALLSRTYTCDGPDGHVWVAVDGADGIREWSEANARAVRLL